MDSSTEVTMGLLGQTQLFIDGFVYSKHTPSKLTLRWRCIHSHKLKCKGAVTTSVDYPYSRVSNFRPHSHPPQEMTKEVTELRMKMREEALEGTRKPAEIMEKVLAGLPDEVQKNLGNIKTIKRDIRHYRSQKDSRRKAKFVEKLIQLNKTLPLETSVEMDRDADSSCNQELSDNSSIKTFHDVLFQSQADDINLQQNNQELSNNSLIKPLYEVPSVLFPSPADGINLQPNNQKRSNHSIQNLFDVPSVLLATPADEIKLQPSHQELSNNSSKNKLHEVPSVRFPRSADEIKLQPNNGDEPPQETAISVQSVPSSMSLQSGDNDSHQFEFTEVKMETDVETEFEPEGAVSDDLNIWQPSRDNSFVPVFLPPTLGISVQQNPNMERVPGLQTRPGGLKEAPAVGMGISTPSPVFGPPVGSRYTSESSQPLHTDVNREHLSAEISSLKATVAKLENVLKGLEACKKLEDELDHFGKYITSLLRGLPEKTVQMLQTKIITEVFAAKGFQVKDVRFNQNKKKRTMEEVQTIQSDFQGGKRRNEQAVGESTVSQTGLCTLKTSLSQEKAVKNRRYRATQAKIGANAIPHTQNTSFCQSEKISVGNSPSSSEKCTDGNSPTQTTSHCQSEQISDVENSQSLSEKYIDSSSQKPSDSATKEIKTPKVEDEPSLSSLDGDCELDFDIEPGPGMTLCKSEVDFDDTYSHQDGSENYSSTIDDSDADPNWTPESRSESLDFVLRSSPLTKDQVESVKNTENSFHRDFKKLHAQTSSGDQNVEVSSGDMEECGRSTQTGRSTGNEPSFVGSQTVKKRIWDKRDCCFYCEKLVTNFTRHLSRKHSEEQEVGSILAFPKGSENRKPMFESLRRKGNFLYNTKCLRGGTRGLIVVQKPRKKDLSQYQPCKICLGYFSKKCLYRHVKNCKKKGLGVSTRNAQGMEGLGDSSRNVQGMEGLGDSSRNAQGMASFCDGSRNAQGMEGLGDISRNAQGMEGLGDSSRNAQGMEGLGDSSRNAQGMDGFCDGSRNAQGMGTGVSDL